MKFTFLLFWSILASACTKNESGTGGEYLTREARLINQLAVDGCGWHFGLQLNDEYGQFAADQGSNESLVEPFIQSISSQNGVYSVNVEITFKLTQNKREVQCGWGKKSNMDEIEIKEIKKL